MVVNVAAISRDLRLLADIADDASPDYLLFRVEAMLERLIDYYETADTEVDPVVYGDLCEVVQRLQIQVASSGGHVGRPALELSMQAVEMYLLAGLTVPEIARLLDVSVTV